VINIKEYKKYEDYNKMIDGTLYKKCYDCNEWIMADLDHFSKVNENKDGLNTRCKLCQKKYNLEYYSKTRDHQIELSKKNQKDNWDRHKEKVYEYYHNNEAYRLRQIAYAQTDKYREGQSKWRRTESGKRCAKISGEKRSQKKHKVDKREWVACKEYFNNECAYCGLPITQHFRKHNDKFVLHDLHKEHVDDEGSIYLDNCIPSCQSCNSSKRKQKLFKWYNIKNPKFEQIRLDKILQWLSYDYKKYINPKRKIKENINKFE
jgi:hypothetical protein